MASYLTLIYFSRKGTNKISRQGTDKTMVIDKFFDGDATFQRFANKETGRPSIFHDSLYRLTRIPFLSILLYSTTSETFVLDLLENIFSEEIILFSVTLPNYAPHCPYLVINIMY